MSVLCSPRLAFRVSTVFLLLTAFPAVLFGQQKPQAKLDAALIAAIRQNNTQEALSLLKQGANPNAREVPPSLVTSTRKPASSLIASTALFVVLGWRGENAYQVPENVPLLQALIDKGSKVHVKMERGVTALMVAAGSKKPATLRLLLKAGAPVNDRDTLGGTALSASIAVQDVEGVRLLLQKGANVHFSPAGPDGILELAQLYGNRQIVRLLQQAGARPINKRTMAQARLRSLKDINTPDERGITPLMQAIIERNLPLVSMLLSRGANIHQRDQEGRTALWFAANNGIMPLVRTLLQRGADINVTGKHSGSPLMGAIWGGKREMVEFLLKQGADPTVAIVGQSGHVLTAMSIAKLSTHALSRSTNQRNEQIIDVLTQAGARQ